MEQIQTLRAALGDVPVTLLTTDAARVLDGAFSSLDIIERSEADRPVVVLVGPTGAGKSYVFNAVVGADVSPEGVLRPTTSSAVVAGAPSRSLQARIPDAVIVHSADIGVTLVDTPAPDEGHRDAGGLVACADLVVMVVSPIRYADATVAELWESLDPSKAALVLNRAPAVGEETRDLFTSVSDRFGMEPYVIFEGGAGRDSIADHLVASTPRSRSDVVASIMVRVAAAGARFVIREVTNAAPDIGKVTRSVNGIPDCVTDASLYDVQTSWDGTRDEIVAGVVADVSNSDEIVVQASETELAGRVLESIGVWDGEDLSRALDAWRDRCVSTFSDASSVRWRRANAEQLIERFSWSTAINPGIVAPKRFSRIMGATLEETTSQMRSGLEALVCEYVDGRLAVWLAKLDRIGSYQPGALASAADAIDRQQPVRD